jgi:hypothetical protein
MHYFVANPSLLCVENKKFTRNLQKTVNLTLKFFNGHLEICIFEFTNTHKNGSKIYDLNGYKLFYSKNW